jgi:hypothetical protein
MSNERLRSQIAAAGLTIAGLAEHLDLDPKTVERWITKERVPYRKHRIAAASVLDVEESYLWPSVADDPRTLSASQAEVVALYPNRGAVPADLWGRLLHQATDCVDLLVYSGLFLLDSQPDFIPQLVAKAGQGMKARILLGDPVSPVVDARGAEEGIGSQMATRAQLSIESIKPALGEPGIDVRTHATPLYNSIYRFDDQVLVNLHAYGWQAPQNPVLHLRRIPGGRLFDHYLTSFDWVWATARDLS